MEHIQTECPKCHEAIEVEVPSTQHEIPRDKFGYREGTIGSFIATQIETNPEGTLEDLRKQVLDKFGKDSIARIRRVIYEMRKNGFVQTERSKTTIKFVHAEEDAVEA